MTATRGIVALGDSITRGRGGAPALGVHPQSWAIWLAEALDLPLHNLAADGATTPDLVRDQLPRVAGAYDLATLFVGANDARGLAFDAAAFESKAETLVATLSATAERVLVLTVPLDLGRPRAGHDVIAADAALRRRAAAHGVLVCGLEDLRGPRFMLPDAVHPTSPGMAEIAARALDVLAADGMAVPGDIRAAADERTDPGARARYAAWWLRQLARDHRRRHRERAQTQG